jgi:hypothetical protein
MNSMWNSLIFRQFPSCTSKGNKSVQLSSLENNFVHTQWVHEILFITQQLKNILSGLNREVRNK